MEATNRDCSPVTRETNSPSTLSDFLQLSNNRLHPTLDGKSIDKSEVPGDARYLTVPNTLPLSPGAKSVFKTFTADCTALAFLRIPTSTAAQRSSSTYMYHQFDIWENSKNVALRTGRKGWPRPGPGPKAGRRRTGSLKKLEEPFMMALLHLTKEALHRHQIYNSANPADASSQMISLGQRMAALNQLQDSLTVSQALLKTIWSLTPQLGVPSFLVKVSSTPHALALYMLPNRPGFQWWCTYCVEVELQTQTSCPHVSMLRLYLEKISLCLNTDSGTLLEMMAETARSRHVPDLTAACFYGNSKKMELAVVRSSIDSLSLPIDHSNRIYILRHYRKARKWTCLGVSCSGISSQGSQGCNHTNTLREHLEQGPTIHFCNIFEPHERDNTARGGHEDEEDIKIPRYARHMIPSDIAFQVDFEVNRNARNNSSMVIPAASFCHCGCSRNNELSSQTDKLPLRVEAARCHANYFQEVWMCKEGHRVLPEEDESSREGIVWISKDTAYTEVFLFDMLLHMVLGSATISSQANIRSQILHLEQDYTCRGDAPRSQQSLRKALTLYAMSVVKGLEDWVFRCSKCAVPIEEGVYYNTLCFDGQQIGFSLKHDVRYDFYGKKAMHWRRTVERCTIAWQKVHLIESQALRSIIFEALRVRRVPTGCNSVHSLCRLMMNISLHTREQIRAAVAAIKLFDEDWKDFAPECYLHADESSIHAFIESHGTEQSSHPLDFIAADLNEASFQTGIHILNLFRTVLNTKKAAAILAVLLTNLREDLRMYIPSMDLQLLHTYGMTSYNVLNIWLFELSQSDDEASVTTPSNLQGLQESLQSGIAEHDVILKHPYRSTWSWIRAQSSSYSHDANEAKSNRLCTIRNVGPWICPAEATYRVILLIMALCSEPVSVWLRNGCFDELEAAVQVFANAELFCGGGGLENHCRAPLHQVKGCVLVYEGIMGMLGADDIAAKGMYRSVQKVFQSVMEKYSAYKTTMETSEAKNPSNFSPKHFDEMLEWSGAFMEDGGREDNDPVTTSFMRDKYKRMASARSEDFLKSGVWAPDFPIRRPSPSTTMWGTDHGRADKSCSKRFDVNCAFSPGTFGGYCDCTHAKTVLIMFLKQPEGCRMPLNFVVERCSKLPRHIIYDFACGLQKAAIGLSSRLVEATSFIVDPFHFPGHKTCSLAMHQSSYSELRGRNTESQEQRNIGLRSMERSLRAFRDIHFMHFVILAHAYRNLKAMFKDHHEVEPSEWGSRGWIRWVRENLFDPDRRERLFTQ